MRSKAILTILLMLWGYLNLIAAKDSITIYGKSPEYAGMTLIFERTDNFITNESTEVVRFEVDATGVFTATFSLPSTTRIFTDIGQYRAFMYAQPGQTYQITLPPYLPRPLAERFNPFFKPEDIEIGLMSDEPGQLNKLIIAFDDAFFQQYDNNALSIFKRNDIAKANKIVTSLDSVFNTKGHPFFENHKTARYIKLYNLAAKRSKRQLISDFTKKTDIDFLMPAYTETFNELFGEFFIYYFPTNQGLALRNAFNEQKDFKTLSQLLASDTLFQLNDLRESIILKSLFDGFYTERYNKNYIENLIEQAILDGSTTNIKQLAYSINRQIKKLKVGTPAPPFTAYNVNGKEVSSESFRGKFVYLAFAHTQNFSCKKDLIALIAVAREYKRELEVVTILTDEDEKAAFTYIKNNNINYNVLHLGGNGKVLLDYNVKAMPTYLLIDPEGNISVNSMAAPGETFAKVLQDTMRQYKINKARKSPDIPRTIYDIR
jgi:peroxiredoxin